MPELLGLPFSPWSEKARWALDSRHVAYTSRTYAPLVGEPLLRLKLGKWSGTVTVPVLTDDQGTAIGDSAEIARWADKRGQGPVLFPPELEARVVHFVELSERGLAAGRTLSLPRMLESDEALREMVPKPLRKPLGPLASRMGAFGVRRTLRKYGGSALDQAKREAAFVAVLDELREALATATGSPKTLLGQFTFADIAMAQVLAFVEPPAFGLRIGRASRASFTDAALRERYADLIAWRDALYDAHRPKV
jgi:glutathione S-transferase